MTKRDEDPSTSAESDRSTSGSKSDRAKEGREWTIVIATIVALVVSIPGLLIAWHSDRAATQQQRADRFATAAGLLAAPSTGSRTAGVRALRQLVDEFPEERTAVIDLLAAYLSGTVPRPAQAGCSPAWVNDPAQRDVRAALAAAVELYGQQRAEEKGASTGHRLDLSALCLPFAQLAGKDLSYADLSGSWLLATDLTGANLDCALMNSAFLQDTRFAGARVRGAYLAGAVFKVAGGDAPLTRVDMRGADFTNAHFVHRADRPFTLEADLGGAIWQGARIEKVVDLPEGEALEFEASATSPESFGAGHTAWKSDKPDPAPCPRVTGPESSPAPTPAPSAVVSPLPPTGAAGTPSPDVSAPPPPPPPTPVVRAKISINSGQQLPRCGTVRGKGYIPPGMVVILVAGDNPYFPSWLPAVPDKSGGWSVSYVILGDDSTPDGTRYAVQALLLTRKQGDDLVAAAKKNAYGAVSSLPKPAQRATSELRRQGDGGC
ncbi:pentapeptide repeat-containing protein [Catellatospora sp. KI3]|uniref:pentapeptide repeat-containing protein n=1 Tax=Catellatospora sp. KI3 TaxID=3041620 RepID=UPI00248283F0|nr:pentapeptide repeat-containing protein [Catellatospora sp. KI3]MDI1461276.1 pentapeptide repeat-containing protein [Catellatospora sp. KI3]